MKITDKIKVRRSVRTYKKENLTKEIQELVNKTLSEISHGPLESTVRFKLKSSSENQSSELKGLGTYGFIKNPPAFIVGTTEDTRQGLFDYGYLMEKVIIEMTGLNLGTCWLGGSFSRSSFSKVLQPRENEIIPAVTPVGISDDNMSFSEKLNRKGAKFHSRKSWNELYFQNDFNSNLSEKDAGAYIEPLEMLRIGPSASNKQPWRIIKKENSNIFHFYCTRSKGYYNPLVKFFKIKDLQLVDIGISMYHFEETAKELNLKGSWKIEDPEVSELPELTEYCISWIGK